MGPGGGLLEAPGELVVGPDGGLSWILASLSMQYGAWWTAILATGRPEQRLGFLDAPEELVVGPGGGLSRLQAGLSIDYGSWRPLRSWWWDLVGGYP